MSPSLPETACAPEPAIPASDDDQSAALYQLGVLVAGRDCREKFYANLAAVKEPGQ